MTTDGFLYTTNDLKNMGILDRKGFPESYDMEKLTSFLYHVKNGEKFEVPIYSHETYDILPNQSQIIDSPDILIVEGLMSYKHAKSTALYQ
ncbi:Pantothenate kinase [Lactococcus lactis]|nr:Pantothenate kinase [Lactococcus lactis]